MASSNVNGLFSTLWRQIAISSRDRIPSISLSRKCSLSPILDSTSDNCISKFPTIDSTLDFNLEMAISNFLFEYSSSCLSFLSIGDSNAASVLISSSLPSKDICVAASDSSFTASSMEDILCSATLSLYSAGMVSGEETVPGFSSSALASFVDCSAYICSTAFSNSDSSNSSWLSFCSAALRLSNFSRSALTGSGETSCDMASSSSDDKDLSSSSFSASSAALGSFNSASLHSPDGCCFSTRLVLAFSAAIKSSL
mmetsp:Transcript_13854/g.26099  ORF Transcript_13854/g.26099 Transcript_13854/m.26099 type:complete len:255 (+) Transcript_13854:467-1231(+)